jgi:hypothetical protein
MTSELKTTFDIDVIKSTVKSINLALDKLIEEGNTDPFENELKILELFPEFYDNYPFLVKKLCKKQDISMLYNMLENLKQIENGNKTLETVEKKLGEELANEYLYPNLK